MPIGVFGAASSPEDDRQEFAEDLRAIENTKAGADAKTTRERLARMDRNIDRQAARRGGGKRK